MYLKLNTTYRPFTYDELIKPLVEYGKAYKEVEESYTTLADQAAAFSNKVNQTESPKAYDMYTKYTEALNSAMEDFSKGMTSGSRAKLLQMKKDYSNTIVPIAKAAEEMKAANAFRDKAGPDAIFEKDRYTSLDPFLRGEVANNKYINASQIASMANAAGLAAGSTLYDEMLTGDTSTREKIAESIASQLGEGYANNEKVVYAINAGLDNATATLASKQILSASEKESIRKADRAFNEGVRQFTIGLKTKGLDKKGNIDPDNPYWAMHNLKYDKEKKIFVSTKPGNKGTTTTMIPTFASTRYFKSGDNTIYTELPDGEGIKGTKVTIIPENDKYVLKLGDTELGSITIKDGEISKSVTLKNGDKVAGKDFDEDYDTASVMYLLDTIQSILNNEGTEGLKNYEHYIRFDNEYYQDRGGAYTEPLKRVKVPTTNNDESNSSGGNPIDENLGG